LALNYTKYNEEETFEVATGVPLSYVKQGQQIAFAFVLVSIGITIFLSVRLATRQYQYPFKALNSNNK
jgi:hypothetical protein